MSLQPVTTELVSDKGVLLQSPHVWQSSRLTRISDRAGAEERIGRLLSLAVDGLGKMAVPGRPLHFTQTVRGVRSKAGPILRPEGDNLRYAAIVSLGAALLHDDMQRHMLGSSASELATDCARRAADAEDPGAIALAAWAQAEVNNAFDGALFGRLAQLMDSGRPVPTVDASWALTAATVASDMGDTAGLADKIAGRLLAEQCPGGIFPHHLPRAASGRFREHIGCFADQVYPIQALARLHRLTGAERLLDAASRCADRIVELQGDAGQWWWHYDARTSNVVEGYPVYSVHQHAMAPMALSELDEISGSDRSASITLGVDWLYTHPEVLDELISERHRVVWRKVGRREPAKGVRKAAAVLSSVRPGLGVPLRDQVFPATVVDHECRPYELGWLLYAWLTPSLRPGR